MMKSIDHTMAALGLFAVAAGGCTRGNEDGLDAVGSTSTSDTGTDASMADSTTGSGVDDESGESDDGQESEGTVDGTSGGPDTNITPVECRFTVADDLVEGADYECGDLSVSEQRGLDGAPDIAVHFVRFFGPVASSSAMLYLDGGPGSSGQGFAGLPSTTISSLTQAGDFVVLGQRGTAVSSPALLCDPGTATPKSVAACRDVLESDAIDLAAYTTVASADDIEELRVGLAYDEWTLLGTSYGTRLAQEVMRRNPSTVRAAVLDAVAPTDINWDKRAYVSFWQAMQGLSEACVADPICEDAFGSVDQALIDMIATLDATPIFAGPPGQEMQIDGTMAAGLVFRLMYFSELYPMIPLIIASFRDDDLDAIQTLLMLLFSEGSGVTDAGLALGMHWSVKCSDLYNPELGPDLDVLLEEAAVPEPLADAARQRHAEVVEICDGWPKPGPEPSLTQPVQADVPTLLASGAFDPITPPEYAQHVATGLSQASTVVFANSGHGTLSRSDCAGEIVAAFVADPDAAVLDTACASEIPVTFVTSEDEFFGDVSPRQRLEWAVRLRLSPS